MKQTAVDWLEQQLFDKQGKFTKGDFMYAKEMEKQQIVDAHGNKEKKSAGVGNYLYTLSGERYYNETYGSNGSDATSSKIEISNLEICKESYKRYKEIFYCMIFAEGAKWYRKQLKERSCR